MASTSGHEPHSSTSHGVNPAADLDLLERSRAVVLADQARDLGPLWYAPLLAAVIGGFALTQEATTGVHQVVAAVVAFASAAVVVVHNHRHRPIRERPSLGRVIIVMAFAFVFRLAITAWRSAISSLGYERFIPGYAIFAWAVTTVAVLGVGAGVIAMRRRWPRLQ